MNFINEIDSSWTLFLDRDGVINHEKKDDYIRNAGEFIFYDGILEALKKLSEIFGIIVIVTNQRGIGRGLMTHQDLNEVHEFMLKAIHQFGGRIDRIYYAPDLESDAIDRKPNIGMGLTAKTEFPSIDFTKSVMVGNNLSDMKFGKGLEMKTVYVETTKPLHEDHELIDIKLNGLVEFAGML
ncbi:MAG TPA: HAD-IIIA family hydrolase [Chitinophagaceae bacterium]|nr:HAD-IIIA family hydrolase [Chitinophagaceae bacterium]